VTTDPRRVLERGEDCVLVLPLYNEVHSTNLLRLRSAYPQATVVACVDDACGGWGRRAFVCGALAVVDDSMSPDVAATIIALASCGLTAAPRKVIASALGLVNPVPPLNEDDQELLRLLASDMTVSALARQRLCSERSMYRVLKRLYDRLGAENRAEAMVLARRMGLAIDHPGARDSEPRVRP
jgi:DNA-binding NarL/FixJ family response regulator